MERIKVKFSVYVALAMLFLPVLVWAGEEEKVTNVFELGEIVVTADRDTITKAATVETIDQSRMILTNINNVSDALDTLPGVVLSVGSRNEKYFSVRGFNQRYVPVLYDGIPIYIPYDGYVDSGNIPTGNISKISLTKGASSVLYGPNTMGGVINIISKKPIKSFEGDYKISLTDNTDMSFDLNLGSMGNRYYFTANLSGLDTDGFNLSKDFKATDNEDGDERDNSDNKQWSGSFKAGFIPSENHEYAIGINMVKSEKGLPPSAYERARYWRFSDWEKKTFYLVGDSLISEKLSTKVRLFYDTYYNVLDSYDDDTYTTQTRRYAFHSTYDDYSEGGSLTVRSEHLSHNALSFAVNYKDDIHRAQGDYDDEWERYEADSISYGLEDDVTVNDDLSAVLGINYDIQREKYANGADLRGNISSFNPQFGANYDINDSTSMHFSVGKKTRFPNLKDLYSDRFGEFLPNPDLKSETAVNYEAGIARLLNANSRIEINLFYSDIKNLIVAKTVAEEMEQNQNVGKAAYKGIELVGKTGFIANNQIEMSYTYLDAKNKSADRTSDFLEENAKHKIYLSDNFRINDMFSIFGKFELNSKRYYEDADGAWQTLDGFYTVDAKLMINMTQNMLVELGSKNVLDKNYETKYGYPREGRSFFITASGNF